ncbi:MAG: FkbM family methyltransferase [Bacteroidota bacterium]
MKETTQIIHKIVRGLRVEEWFIALGRRSVLFRKFIPLSSAYDRDDDHLIVRDGTRFKVNRSDYVQWRLFYAAHDNAWQLAKKYVTPHSTILDVGASFGSFSLRLATFARQHKIPGFKINAFEPNPIMFKRYLHNLTLNPDLSETVQVRALALGNESAHRSFQYPETNSGVGKILPRNSPGQFAVEVQPLDRLSFSNISFIKIIVEGFEPEVLKGGWNTIEKFKPAILFEATPEWYAQNQSSLSEITTKLKSLGYTLKGDLEGKFVPYDEAVFQSRYQFNILAEVDDRFA